MLALQYFCRWLLVMFFLSLTVFIITFTFILNVPVKQNTVVVDLNLKLSYEPYGVDRVLTNKEMICLADNIFFEAGNQSDLGKKAVAYVTLNRMYSSKFPDNICNIVYAKKDGVCQFSWVCKPVHIRKRKQKEHYNWLQSMAIANHVVYSYHWKDDPTYGALHFHADYVKPFWSKVYNKTVVIDNHIFYRPKYGT